MSRRLHRKVKQNKKRFSLPKSQKERNKERDDKTLNFIPGTRVCSCRSSLRTGSCRARPRSYCCVKKKTKKKKKRWVILVFEKYRRTTSSFFGFGTVCKARKEEHAIIIIMSFPIGDQRKPNRRQQTHAACKKSSNAISPLWRHRKKAPFLPDEFSQKDLFVRVERLFLCSEREREREREGHASARRQSA